MQRDGALIMEEVRHLRWRLGQVEQERDDYRALWEEKKLEHQRSRERMAQAMDEAYSNGYQAGRVEGYEAGLLAGEERIRSRIVGVRERLSSISCLVAEGPEFMRPVQIYDAVQQDVLQGIKVLDGEL